MGVLNNKVWNKSYMLEFIDGAGVVENAFTFSVPPESEEITLPNRVSETKTFGGSIFDSYGNDTMRIVLSGSTINEELKLIYRGLTLPPFYLSGESEILKLQSLIKEWNERPQTGVAALTGEKKIYLYDLSKMNTIQLTTGVGRNYWEVYIREFKIKRDKSRPLAYSYTLDMLGLPDTTTNSVFEALEGVTDVIQGIETAIETAETVSEYTQGVFDLVDDITNDIEKAQKAYEAKKDPSLLTVALATDSGVRILTGTGGNTFYNSAKDVLSIAQRINDTFNGNANEGKEYTTKDTSVYTVNFSTNGGGYIKSQSVEYGGKVVRPTDPEKERYEFLGWYKDEDLTEVYGFTSPVTSDITLYAKWNLLEAKVTFRTNQGSVNVSSQTVKIGECATRPTDPTCNGYVFISWCVDSTLKSEFDFSTTIQGDITLYAKWEAAYTVTFDSDGGTEVESQHIKEGEYVVYPLTPKKAGNTFLGWFNVKDDTLYDFLLPVTEEITLKAQWTHTSSVVTFNTQGGSEIESQEVTTGKTAVEPTNPTKIGYRFSFWSTDASGTTQFDFGTVIQNDITLYAIWTQETCTVTFDLNGGEGIEERQGVLYNDKLIFPGRPERSGYIFDSWQKKNEDEEYEEYDFSLPVTEDFTLKAKWAGEDL